MANALLDRFQMVNRGPMGDFGGWQQPTRTSDRLPELLRAMAAQIRPGALDNTNPGYGRPGIPPMQRSDVERQGILTPGYQWVPFGMPPTDPGMVQDRYRTPGWAQERQPMSQYLVDMMMERLRRGRQQVY